MKNKGFVLLETLVASTFILGVMIFLFIQFSSIKRSYETSFHYNTVPGLYHAKEFANFLKRDGYLTIDDQLTNSTKGYVDITNCLYSGSLCKQLVFDMKAKKILYVGENISNLKNNLSTSNYNKDVFSESLKRFILQMNSVEPNGRSRIIVEYKDNTYATVLIDLSDMNDVRAEYKINYYLMNVNGNGYSLKETETYTDQVYSKVSPNPKQYEGFTSPSLQTLVVDPKGISELNYYYTRNQYNFILKTGTGTTTTGSTSSGKYYYGTKISLKATTATGYTWSKWVSNSSKVTNITTINSNFTMPASDIEVTSTATLNTYTIAYNLNDGILSHNNPTTYTVNSPTFTLNNPNKVGYSFTGWTGSNGSIKEKSVTILGGSTGNKNYEANFDINSYQLFFDANGGSVGQTSKTLTYHSKYGGLPTPNRSGYTFIGWYTERNGGTQVTSETIMESNNVTLYAHWSLNVYTIVFNANGGTVSSSNKSVLYGSSYGQLPIPSRNGYTFLGWFTGSGIQVNSGTIMGASNVILYAHWQQNDYTAPAISRNSVTAITAIGGGTPNFTISYNVRDDISGVVAYYWGDSIPNANSGWISSNGGNIDVSFYLERRQNYVQRGNKYFGVKDACGNINYTEFKWLMTWYDGSTGWGIQIPTDGLNYFVSGENHWGTIWIKDESRSTKLAEFRANSGASGTLDGNTSVWIGWEAFAFAAWN